MPRYNLLIYIYIDITLMKKYLKCSYQGKISRNQIYFMSLSNNKTMTALFKILQLRRGPFYVEDANHFLKCPVQNFLMCYGQSHLHSLTHHQITNNSQPATYVLTTDGRTLKFKFMHHARMYICAFLKPGFIAKIRKPLQHIHLRMALTSSSCT